MASNSTVTSDRGRAVLLTVVLALVLTALADKDFYELLGVERSASQKEIRQAFKKKALSMHPDKNTDDPGAHDKFLRINRAYEVLKDEELRKKYDQFGEEGLKENAPSGGGYRSWKFYQQEFGLYDDDPNIITLSRSDFESSVDSTQDVWFINFYSPHCSHCHELSPTWRQLAVDLDGVVRIGAVNCEDDWMLCRQKGIHGYPSLMMYPSGEKFTGDRTARELVRFALRRVKAKVVDLWSGNFDDVTGAADTITRPWVINACGDGGDCMQKQSVKKLAAMLTDLVNVGVLDCRSNEDLCGALSVEAGVYFFEAAQLKGSKPVRIESLDAKDVSSAVLRQLPDMNVLDQETLTTVLENLASGNEAPWLIHFVEGATSDVELRKLPMLLNTLRAGRVDCEVMRDQCTNLHIAKTPSFVLFKPGGGHEIHHGRLTAHDIAAFAKDSAQTSVVVLGPGDFPDRVVNGAEPWFVDFYAPWCPPCMRLLPEFRKASKWVAQSVHFGTVDCTVHVSLCQNYNVRSYPTTIFYNHTVPHQFRGHHTAQALVEFIEDTLNPPVMNLDTQSFEQVVGSKDAHQMVLVDFFAPWCGPCQQLAPEWRKFSKLMAQTPNVKVAHVDCQAQRDLCATQDVTSYPTIRLYPMGAVGSSYYMRYEGWMRDAGSLRAWAFSYLPSKTRVITSQSFTQDVLSSSEPWVLDFYAPWCGHCQTFAPEFERVAQAMEGSVRAGKVNCDQQPALCQQAGIRAYPSVRFYRGSPGGTMQNAYGQDLNSQSGDYIINFLQQQGFQQKPIRDEL